MEETFNKLSAYRDTFLEQYAIQALGFLGAYRSGDLNIAQLAVAFEQLIGIKLYEPVWEELEEKIKFDETLRHFLSKEKNPE